jgi:hypothetical protein
MSARLYEKTLKGPTNVGPLVRETSKLPPLPYETPGGGG